jgi:DNA-binding NarL/FixJ family response regulator
MVVDGQQIVRDGIACLLGGDDRIDVAAVSPGDPEVPQECVALDIGVVVTDIDLPEVDGIELVRRVRSESPATLVLILTSAVDWRILPAMAAGASGFLLKDADPESLGDAIKAVHRGEQVLCREAAEWLAEVGPGSKRLTRREVAVLQMIARGKTNGEIADSLGISEKTVRNHVSSLYRKLSLRNRVQIAAYAARAQGPAHLLGSGAELLAPGLAGER